MVDRGTSLASKSLTSIGRRMVSVVQQSASCPHIVHKLHFLAQTYAGTFGFIPMETPEYFNFLVYAISCMDIWGLHCLFRFLDSPTRHFPRGKHKSWEMFASRTPYPTYPVLDQGSWWWWRERAVIGVFLRLLLWWLISIVGHLELYGSVTAGPT